jgi:hypothetical protein
MVSLAKFGYHRVHEERERSQKRFRGTQREAAFEHARLLRARDLGMSIKPSVAEY